MFEAGLGIAWRRNIRKQRLVAVASLLICFFRFIFVSCRIIQLQAKRALRIQPLNQLWIGGGLLYVRLWCTGYDQGAYQNSQAVTGLAAGQIHAGNPLLPNCFQQS